MSVVVYVVLLFLSVVGLCDIIHMLHISFYNVRNKKNKIICLLLRDSTADLQLCFVAEQYRWMGSKYADKVIAVNQLSGQDADLLCRCRQIAEQNDILFLEDNDINSILN